MQADPIQRAVDEDLVRVLYAQDLLAFFTHWFSIAVLTSMYWAEMSALRFFNAWLVFYAAANCLGLALWLWHRHWPAALSPRAWINLHALRGALLYSAPGLSIWFAFHSTQAELPLLHTVLIVTLAAGVFMSNGFDTLNFSVAIPLLLLPAIVLHFSAHSFERIVVGIVVLFFFSAINLYAISYRKLFRSVVQARVDQQRLAESLAVQKHVAVEAGLAKTRFFAAASHDLRQPLHAIGLLAASLGDMAAPSAERARAAENIVRNVEALNQLFNQVLDLSRIESGVTQVMRVDFRLAELFERIGGLYRPQAAAKGLALRIAPTSMVLYDDPVLLERVLGNLVANAVRYTDEGSIWVGLRRAGRADGGYVEVRDSGIGIPPGEHERIFEEFYRGASAERDARPGHGLGLPTVRRLVGLLGGELQLRSAPGRGSTFRFPVRAGDPGRVVTGLAALTPTGVPPGMATAAGRRVLCVDDEPAIREGIASLLGHWGCVVKSVANEDDACDAIAEGFAPDAVLCDYQLGNGRAGRASNTAFERVRGALARHGAERAVLLVITGDMASPELKALAGEGVPILHKPVNPARLLRTLQTAWRDAADTRDAAASKPAAVPLPPPGAPSASPPPATLKQPSPLTASSRPRASR
ncbi:hybrid sensor histidine kinase/response regulator [Trinickia violacea]|uniref:histidine kinase n=1 Tax=Trinickia violacea TaxID=2571746 RepID=A0A4P8J0Y7_9BURK|nr:hybrid sensor histidine kinase/response regulator [Trinickia violacea]QCP53985.1 hybrid sensor histidine kinase/response regulator [Trinickia violacea]